MKKSAQYTVKNQDPSMSFHKMSKSSEAHCFTYTLRILWNNAQIDLRFYINTSVNMYYLIILKTKNH